MNRPFDAPKTGFLLEDFRIFHLKGASGPTPPHYHDFCKVVALLKGSIRYTIEGRSYDLEPNDIVLVDRGEIHCPHVSEGQSYERVILYLSPAFLEQVSPGAPLNRCFLQARYRHSGVLRPSEKSRHVLLPLLRGMAEAQENQDAYASPLLARALLLEFLVQLNRTALDGQAAYLHTGSLNYQVSGLISYINSHLEEELSIDLLSRQCCLSPYHMMRLFKEETGCTIGSYISQKRLSLARDLMAEGLSATQSCFRCGFSSYSAFLRAYKRQFGETPGRGKRDK